MTSPLYQMPLLPPGPGSASRFGRLAVMFCMVFAIAGCAPQARLAPHPDEPAIRSFLDRYFGTWSSQDMEGYAACFAPEARITYAERDGTLRSEGLTDFLHGQKMSHETATEPMKEVPLTMEITGDMRLAQARVSWKLTKGNTASTGIDCFTLCKVPDGWKIAALVFYQD